MARLLAGAALLLGSAQLAMGEHSAAHEVFVQIYGINSNYRDVSEKMQEAAAGG